MNLTITPRFTNNQNRGQSVGFRALADVSRKDIASRRSSVPKPYRVDKSAQELVVSFAENAQNEPRQGAYGQKTILKTFQTLLGDIESGEKFRHLKPKDKWEVLRRAVDNGIEALKPLC